MSSRLTATRLKRIKPGDILCNPDACFAGSGGFGDVLYGYHRVLKEFVAIKIFSSGGGKSGIKKLHQSVADEIQHLYNVNHPNVVQVYGYVEWGYTVGIVMEYCVGGNLRDFLVGRKHPLELVLRVRLLLEIASAIAACHGLGKNRFVHGDLKPTNVLLCPGPICKLGDFGTAETAPFSRECGSAKSRKREFTPGYTAPEKLRNPNMKPTPSLDVYSFGMMMFTVLALEEPFQKEKRGILPPNIHGKLPNCGPIQTWKSTLNDVDKRIAENLETMMKHCWDSDPSARPTMSEITDELQKLLDQQSPGVLQKETKETVEAATLDSNDFNMPLPVLCLKEGYYQGPVHHGQNAPDTAYCSGTGTSNSECGITAQYYDQSTVLTHFRRPREDTGLQKWINHRHSGLFVLLFVCVWTVLEIQRQHPSTFLVPFDEPKGVDVDVRCLLQEYKKFLQLEMHSKANETAHEIAKVVKRKANWLPDDIRATAQAYQSSGKVYEAVCFYQVASILSPNCMHRKND